MKRNNCPRSATRLSLHGLTLVETLFGVAVVVVLIVIAWPVIRGVGDISKLRDAAKQVRNDISKARIDSMASGRIYVIHFVPDSNIYHIGPYEANDPLLEATALELENPSSKFAGGERWSGEPRQLSDEISIELGDFQVEVPEETEKILERPVNPSEIGEGTAVMFYPDGTTSDGMLLLRGPGDYFIELRLRGNEGTVHIGEPYPAS